VERNENKNNSNGISRVFEKYFEMLVRRKLE
jgi:hypothetical protein